jgi:hypothetical protein
LGEFDFVQNQRLEDTTTLRAVDALPIVIVVTVKEMSNTTLGGGYGLSQLIEWGRYANLFATHRKSTDIL